MATATLILSFDTKDYGIIDILCESDGTQLAYFRQGDIERLIGKYGDFTDVYGTAFKVLIPLTCPRDRAVLEVTTPRVIAWATPRECGG